ncbi:molybdenum cofactor biosynthesis protein MoaE [Chloroflexota bacterium]
MIEVIEKPISVELVVDNVKTDSSGCVATYVGLIRKLSRGKLVLSVEYEDVEGKAAKRFQEIVNEIGQQWQVNDVAICHWIGNLKVGDVNLIIAVVSTHRKEGFAA